METAEPHTKGLFTSNHSSSAHATAPHDEGIMVIQASPSHRRPMNAHPQQAVMGRDGLLKLHLHLITEMQLDVQEDELTEDE